MDNDRTDINARRFNTTTTRQSTPYQKERSRYEDRAATSTNQYFDSDCSSIPVSPMSKESVRDIFIRQVRDALLEDSNKPTESPATSSKKSSSSHHFDNGILIRPTQLFSNIEASPVTLRPEMSTDFDVPATNGFLGKANTNNTIQPECRRDTLLNQLSICTYECLICCGKVYHRQSIWNCQSCHNAFHLHCIKKWSASSAIQGEWRCPGCQNVVNYHPKYYYCFCGNVKNPPHSSSEVPHSCGNSCGKKKSSREDCSHLCTLPCHPGPCEDCTAIVSRKCCCGKTKAFVQCHSKASVLCGSTCEKLLNCHIHRCQAPCHVDDCLPCNKTVILECHCGRNTKVKPCSVDANVNYRPKYTCKLVCDKLLNCKNHRCTSPCHPGHCDPCKTSVDVVVSCPCGQTPIAAACRTSGVPLRRSCLDIVPSCGKVCSKILSCGPYDAVKHRCVKNCHNEDVHCDCPLVTIAPCRCGNQQIEISCSEYDPAIELTCQRRCNKKRSCSRHKCTTKCCIDPDHICTIVCNKLLSCLNHRCESLCHNGHCKLCPNVSFEELRCECGEAVYFPPVPCGTSSPPCEKPCLRTHQCDHPVLHQCHSEPNCPPCSFLTEKWCFGKHELRKNIPCYNNNISCGLPCGKNLTCGRHSCQKTCHAGDCESKTNGSATTCDLKCGLQLKCGHSCVATCHAGDCPSIVCKQMAQVKCPCGRRQEVTLCFKRQAEFQQLLQEAILQESKETLLNAEEQNAERQTVLMKEAQRPSDITIVLKCDKECMRVERMRKIAEALQLHNPDPETRIGPPNYSDFLKKFALKNPQFVEVIHHTLSTLVMQTKKSSKKNTTHAFDSMNREKRTVIHEYSDHFGCQSESFDEEPNRNVVVTASKDKCWLPSVSLVDVVFRKAAASTGRQNVYQDLELTDPPKTKIIGPANLYKRK